MLEIWIPITIAAAFFQNLRSALQKHIKGKLSTVGAAYARFLYALPVALVYLWLLWDIGDLAIPSPNLTFLLYCALGGVCQIMFTVTLLWLFSFKSFAVGTTFSKLEVIMVALLGAFFLGDTLSQIAILAIGVSSIGVVALSAGQANLTFKNVIAGLREKSTVIGLVSAAWLGGSVVFYRGAALALSGPNFVIAAAYTLTVSLLIQTIIMGAYLYIKERDQLAKIIIHWRWAGAVGVAGALASIGWFTAFTIQNASYVRALGQIELIFTFLATTLFFKEKVSFIELLGILCVGGGIVLIVLYG